MIGRPLQRAIRVSAGVWVGIAACAVLGSGAWQGKTLFGAEAPSVFSLLLLAGVLLLLFAVISRRLRYDEPSVRAQRVSRWMRLSLVFADFEVALALVAAMYAVFAVTGGPHSDFYPLLYAIVAFSATFQTPLVAVMMLLTILGLELSVFSRGVEVSVPLVLLHIGFVAGASLLHAIFLRTLIYSHRVRHLNKIAIEIERQKESARDYRLISVALGAESRVSRTRKEQEEILQFGSVASISSSIYHTLALLQQALDARSCVLLWVSQHSSSIGIKEIVSDCDAIVDSSEFKLSGALKAVVRDCRALILSHTKNGQVCYYEPGFQAGAFLGIPVMENGYLRGLLCVDREEIFLSKDQDLAQSAAEQILSSVRSEQVFNTVERAKYEHERFYFASALLCKALTLEQVQETAFDAALAIVEFDLGIITLYEPERKRHRICRIRKSGDISCVANLDELSGTEFKENTGLVSMVVKNKHYLPAQGELRDSTTPVFNQKTRVQCESLLVLPLLSADEAIGTLTLASHKKGQFRKDTREMLGVISNQVAVSMQNALMYKQMVTMATTDGLTGLTNHKAFQERFLTLLERSDRHKHKAAMLLCDVDHFKNVNDSYGHPVGDEVLRRVAKVLQEATRKIDISARYGGEEFAVVLEATDLEGALRLAERIREDVGAMKLEAEQGSFYITMSIGVAAFPEDGLNPAVLIERADMSLYHAKESGRNQVVCYRDFDAYRNDRQAS